MNTILPAALALALAGNDAPTVDANAVDLSLAGAAAFVAPVPAAPATPAPQDDWTIAWKWKNGIRFETLNGEVQGKLGGRVQWDTSFLHLDDSLEDAGFTDADGTEFRRARIFVELDLFGDYKMKAEYDFAGQDVDFKDVYVQRNDVLGSADLKVGHFKEPFSLDELTSSRFITFGERALPNAFAPSRNSGVQLADTFAGGAATWALGVFKDSDDAGTNVEDGGFAFTGRATASPVYADGGASLVHLGLGYSRRDQSEVRYRARPEIHLSDRLVDTGLLAADSVDLGNVELAGVLGPVHAEAEYLLSAVDGGSGAPDFDGTGWYVQAGWFLTGESRPYKRSAGTFDRVIPKADHGANGMGAWEIAARWSTLDLTDGGVVGGEEDNVSLGLNWYLNPNVRVGVNYVTGTVDLGGALDSEDVSALLTRVQIDW